MYNMNLRSDPLLQWTADKFETKKLSGQQILQWASVPFRSPQRWTVSGANH